MPLIFIEHFCHAGIVFEAYAPIGSPGRFFKQDDEPNVMEDPVIKEIAEKLNASPAQVSLNTAVEVLLWGVLVSCKADPKHYYLIVYIHK